MQGDVHYDEGKQDGYGHDEVHDGVLCGVHEVLYGLLHVCQVRYDPYDEDVHGDVRMLLQDVHGLLHDRHDDANQQHASNDGIYDADDDGWDGNGWDDALHEQHHDAHDDVDDAHDAKDDGHGNDDGMLLYDDDDVLLLLYVYVLWQNASRLHDLLRLDDDVYGEVLYDDAFNDANDDVLQDDVPVHEGLHGRSDGHGYDDEVLLRRHVLLCKDDV
mmetsp:Transcript_30235/g.48833  ORF Transcript_30235/g.48833 Transcript_30235/m.48833 type:complete len:216 (-) Transcript_30235:591-1238(-)